MPSAGMDTALVRITGTSPLVMDNIEHADPEDPIYRQIKNITDKKSDMTDEDRHRKDHLAFQAALYLREGNLYLPWRCLNRAMRTGAFRIGGAQGSGKVEGITYASDALPFEYGGTPGPLYEHDEYKLRLMVNKNPTGKKAMVPSVRPIFHHWSSEFQLEVWNETISWDFFTRVLEATGRTAGLGNARKLGYGRFSVEVKKL